MTRRGDLGARGEQIAATFLERDGLTILARNVRLPKGELDLIAREGDETVFVEVKTRIGAADVAPDVAVTAPKLDRLARLAELYLERHAELGGDWRIDVVAIVLDERGAVRTLEHLRGAFL